MVSDSGPVVFDTSVVSILFRRDATDRHFSYFQEALAGRHGLISFQTLEELHYWRLAGAWSEARSMRQRQRIDQFEIIWPSPILAEASARLRADLKCEGRTLDAPDAWIAATALRLQCPLTSADHDFRHIPGLHLIQPHEPPPIPRHSPPCMLQGLRTRKGVGHGSVARWPGTRAAWNPHSPVIRPNRPASHASASSEQGSAGTAAER